MPSPTRVQRAVKARASATKPSTGISSARAVGSIAAASSSADVSAPSDFRLWRSILRRWPNAASVTRSSARRSQGRGLARGTTLDQRRCDLGRRHESATGDIEQDARLAAPADQNGKPSVALGAGRGDDALGHLALEHQHKSIIPRRPRLDREPGDQQSRGNVVGQVCNYARGCADKPARIEIQCIARDDLEAAGIARGNFRERGDSAVIPLDCDHPSRACGEQRAGKPTRSGTYFDHLHAVERARSTGDARRRLRSRRKFWPRDFLALSPWRRITSRSGGRSSMALIRTFTPVFAGCRHPAQPGETGGGTRALPRAAERRSDLRGWHGRSRQCRRRCRDRVTCARTAARG